MPNESTAAENRAFGGRVRARREAKGLTLDRMAEHAGISRAMLSKVERGEKSPTIGVASRIARALEVSLSDLTEEEQERRSIMLVRKSERHAFRDAQTGFTREILSPVVAGNAVELLLHSLPGQCSTGVLPPYPADTVKLVHLTQGSLVVSFADGARELQEGDTLYFEADVEHAFNNERDVKCCYFLFIVRCP